MSKTKTTTDPNVIVTLDFKRANLTPDGDGHYSGDPQTLAAAVRGDLQPVKGAVTLAMSGLDPSSTHLFFPETRITAGVKQNDYAYDAAGTQYRLVYVADLGSTYPQEFQLEQLTNP